MHEVLKTLSYLHFGGFFLYKKTKEKLRFLGTSKIYSQN